MLPIAAVVVNILANPLRSCLNVRVWDAEGTLAGFLLSLILDGDDDMYSEIVQSTELSTVREHLRSILMHSTSPSDIKGQSTSPCKVDGRKVSTANPFICLCRQGCEPLFT